MTTQEKIDRLENKTRQTEDDIHGIKQDLVESRSEISQLTNDAQNIRDSIEGIQAKLLSIPKSIEVTVEKNTKSYIGSLANRFLLTLGGAFFGAVVTVSAAMWGFQPVRLFVLENLNEIARLDEFLAYKLTDELPNVSKESKSPLKSALRTVFLSDLGAQNPLTTDLRTSIAEAIATELESESGSQQLKKSVVQYIDESIGSSEGINLQSHLVNLRQKPGFTEMFDNVVFEKIKKSYASQDFFKQIVALTFAHKREGIKYRRHTAATYEMRFYASRDDRGHLFCTLNYNGEVIPPNVDFLLNKVPVKELSRKVVSKSDVLIEGPFEINESAPRGKFGRGIHNLVMLIAPPIYAASGPDDAVSEDVLMDASLDADCFIAVIGPALANALSSN